MRLESSFPRDLRDTSDYYKWISQQNRAILLVVKIRGGKTVGYIVGAELEKFGNLPGVRQDSHFGLRDTVYAESIALLREYRGKGIGRRLIKAFLLRARRTKFRYFSAHARRGFAERLGGTIIWHTRNYYGTHLEYEYFRRELRTSPFKRESKGQHRGSRRVDTVTVK